MGSFENELKDQKETFLKENNVKPFSKRVKKAVKRTARFVAYSTIIGIGLYLATVLTVSIYSNKVLDPQLRVANAKAFEDGKSLMCYLKNQEFYVAQKNVDAIHPNKTKLFGEDKVIDLADCEVIEE